MHLTPEQVVPDLPVQDISKPSRVGKLTGKWSPSKAIPQVEVRWPDETRFAPLARLRFFDEGRDDSIESLVERGEYEKIDVLRSLLTYEKLKGSLTNVVYSMQTADIDFYPHQFVPVLKFIQSPHERLLIADEVGLGKTIEAGLIWTECRARNQARRLLVVCPPTLVPKWVRELNDRFEVTAEAGDHKALLYQVERLRNAGPSHSFAIVTSYHALRPTGSSLDLLRAIVDARGTDEANRVYDEPNPELLENPRFKLLYELAQWEESHAFADLVIFDEGHMMKNTATATHILGRVLEQAAASMILLSATPLTNRTRDLYSLLRLVDPNMFPDEATFNLMRERNIPAIQLANALNQVPINLVLCDELLAGVPESGAKELLRNSIVKLSAVPDAVDLVSLKAQAQRLNEFGTYLSRTRKAEVVGNKVVREPVVLDIDPSPEEKAFYQGFLKLIRHRVRERGDIPGIFHLMASALSLSSCIPAMVRRMANGRVRWGTIDDLEQLQFLTNAFNEDENCDFVGETSTEIEWEAGTLANYDFEANDGKYEALRNELFKRGDDGEKVIVFAFFKETLAYLQRRLEQDGIPCLLVTGNTTDRNERDRLLTSFEDPKFRVLLCSEVAAEGVDLQFCRIIVNYDLPWNPMRVEQRIGRIDRIGQKANTIVVINLLTKGTIDASIYHHLHTKIGLFKETVGDLEGIIGEQLNALTRELLLDELNEAQTDERIRQTALAFENTRMLETEVNQQSENLVGLRGALQESVNRDRSFGRFVKSLELKRFIDDFLSREYSGDSGFSLGWDTPETDCLSLKLGFRARGDFEDFLNIHRLSRPKGFNNDGSCILTFDPEVHARVKGRLKYAQNINHLHPLVRWIAHERSKKAEKWHPVSALTVNSYAVPEGNYFYMIAKISFDHPILKRQELIHRVQALSLKIPLTKDQSELLMQEALEQGDSWHQRGSFVGATEGLSQLRTACDEHYLNIETEFFNELELRRNSKLQQVRAHFGSRIEATERTIQTIRLKPEGERRGLSGFEARLARLRENYQASLGRIESQEPDSDYKIICAGLLRVQNSTIQPALP